MATINGDNSPNTLIGTPDNDEITGFASKDTLVGKEGNDSLYGDYNLNDLSGNPIGITVTMDNESIVEKDFYRDKLFGGDGIDFIIGDTVSANIEFNTVSSSQARFSFKKADDLIVDKLAPRIDNDVNGIFGDAAMSEITANFGTGNKATLQGGDNEIYLTTPEEAVQALVYGNMNSSLVSGAGNFEAKTIFGNNTIQIKGNLTESLVTGNLGSQTYMTEGSVHFYTKFGHDCIEITSVSNGTLVVGDISSETMAFSDNDLASTFVKKYGHDSIDIKMVSSNSLVSGDSERTIFQSSSNTQADTSAQLKYGNDWMGVHELNASSMVGDVNVLGISNFNPSSTSDVIDIKTGKDDIVVDYATNSFVSGDINLVNVELAELANNNTFQLQTKQDWIEVKQALDSTIVGDMRTMSVSDLRFEVNFAYNNTYEIKTGNDDLQVQTAQNSTLVGDVGGEFNRLPNNLISLQGENNTVTYETGRDNIEVEKLIDSTVVGDLMNFDSFFLKGGNTFNVTTKNDWIYVKEAQGNITVNGDIQNPEFFGIYTNSNASIDLGTTFDLKTGHDDISVKKFESGSFYGDLSNSTVQLFDDASEHNTTTITTGNDWISLGPHTGDALVVGDDGNAVVRFSLVNTSFQSHYGDDDISLNSRSTGTSTISGDALNVSVEELDFGNNNVIHRYFGHDSIKGGGGDDLIYGDADLINLSLPSTENDILLVHGNDTIYGGKGNDEIHADTTDFTYNTDHTAMAVDPTAGYQVIYGNDVMSGGKGEDNFVFRVELNPTPEEVSPVLEVEDALMFDSKGQGQDKILDLSKEDTLTLLTTQDVGGTPSGLDPFVDVKTTGNHVTIKFDDGSSIKLLGIAHHQDFDSLQDLSNAGYDIHVETIA